MWWKNIWNTNKPAIEPACEPAATEPDHISVAVRSDVGNVRTNNEDAAIYMRVANKQIADLRGCLLMVADGMGGHQAGEVASRIATEKVSQQYFSRKKTDSITEALSHAYRAANAEIYKLSSLNPTQRGMGTTCTSVVIAGNQLYFAHVGDSRAYLFKRNQLQRITEDHTYVQELLKSKEITPAEAPAHPKRNILTNAMGTKPDLLVDTGKHEHAFEAGDKILICSDGLSEYFPDQELAQYLAEGSPETIADRLIATAKQRGGHDNITVIVAEHRQAQRSPSPETRDIYLPITREYDMP